MRNPASSSPLPRPSSGKTTSCTKAGLKRGPWTPDEDTVLVDYINRNGEGNWRTLPKRAGLLRCGKSCRLRWMNYLRPSVKHGHIEADEEDLILRLHRLLGNRWSLIAGRIPGRTDNEIKNYWNSHLRKKLIGQGIDPKTHLPLGKLPASVSRQYSDVHFSGSGGGASEIGSIDPIDDTTLVDKEVEEVFSSFWNSLMHDEAEASFACQNQPAPEAVNSGYGTLNGTW